MTLRAIAATLTCLLSFLGAAAYGNPIGVREATWRAQELSLVFDLRLAPRLIAAVEAHVALSFLLSVECAGQRNDQRWVLYLAPLTRRYRVTDGFGNAREFPLRSEALASIERVVTPMPGCPEPPAQPPTFRYRLNLAELPSALRVPALLQDEWQLDTGWQRVQQQPAGS